MEKSGKILSKSTKPEPPKSKPLAQESVQYNHQDLDQQQINHNNPVQHNYQSVNVVLGNLLDTLCGTIKGTTHKKCDGEFLPYTCIKLFVPGNTKVPVEKCYSDSKGHFCLKAIPPGYYELVAYKGNGKPTCLYPVKVLPGETITLCILVEA